MGKPAGARYGSVPKCVYGLPVKSLRVGWVGFHQEGIPALEAIIARGQLVGAITLSRSAAAKRAAAADVAGLCAGAGAPVTAVEHINDTSSVETLRGWRADVIFVIGWSQILSAEALDCARIGTIGAHASLLPRLRGSAPINWAIIKGETSSGNSLMWLDADVDNGDLVDQRSFAISAYDTCATLYNKVAHTNRDMIVDALDAFERGEFPRRPQGPTEELLLPRRKPADGLIDWDRDASAVYRFIRALTRPYPGAFTHLDGQKYLVWAAAHLGSLSSGNAQNGQIVGAMRSPRAEATGLIVAVGGQGIALLDLESEDGTTLGGPTLADQPWQGKVFE